MTTHKSKSKPHRAEILREYGPILGLDQIDWFAVRQP
jgi:hypothetical protein